MKKYSCDRCLKLFSQKSHYDTHMNKKRPCQDNRENIKSKIEEVIKNIIIDRKLILNNYNPKEINKSIAMDNKQQTEQEEVVEVGNNDNSFNQISENVSLHIGDSITILPTLSTIDFIYMDPPYDTNRTFTMDSKSDSTGFKDKWGDNEYEKWLSGFILQLKNVLSEKGTLVLHISSENSFIIEKILRENFKNIEKIYWKRCHGKNTVKNKFGAVIDILFVAYNNKRIFNNIRIPIEEDSVWAFKNKDDRGMYSLGALKHDRTRKGHEFMILNGGVEYKSPYGWKLCQEVVERMISENRIHFVAKSHNMYIKVYKEEHNGKPLSNLWDDIHSITRTNKDPRLYPTQKPQKLLERLLLIFTNEDSIVLDPVCGSGTTGFVADKLNRKCIMIDQNPEVLSIIQNRFQQKIYNI